MRAARIVASETSTYEANAFRDVLRDYWSMAAPWQITDQEQLAEATPPDAWGVITLDSRDNLNEEKIHGTAWTSAYEDDGGYIVLANLVGVDYPSSRFHFPHTNGGKADVAEIFAIYKVSEDRQHAEPLEEWTGQLLYELTANTACLLQPMRPDDVFRRQTWTETEYCWTRERPSGYELQVIMKPGYAPHPGIQQTGSTSAYQVQQRQAS